MAIDAGHVETATVKHLPEGYEYGVTRYADVILQTSFAERFSNILSSLITYHPSLEELIESGGGRTVFTKRFDDSLSSQLEDGVEVWGKRNITISKSVGFDANPREVSRVRGHEIDMFGLRSVESPFPGIAVEMEWNNKDPFYDRDLNNFQALHREGAIAVGVIVTRGRRLQNLLGVALDKYGSASTHWDKLIPKVNLGGGGECPLFLVGIEPERILNVESAVERYEDLMRAQEFRDSWRESGYKSWKVAKPTYDSMVSAARRLSSESGVRDESESE
jgi:hypothetical protein